MVLDELGFDEAGVASLIADGVAVTAPSEEA
jgi:hypothetical protein